jgi:hypothetical protein
MLAMVSTLGLVPCVVSFVTGHGVLPVICASEHASDIDAVFLLDSLSAEDLAIYRGIIGGMPHSELACGFVGSAGVLASWPRHELLQFYNDTVPIRGQLPEIAPFSERDAMEAARISASGIYHAAYHALAFDGERLAYAVHPECGEWDSHDNHTDADPELMRLIMESDDIRAISLEVFPDRWRMPL